MPNPTPPDHVGVPEYAPDADAPLSVIGDVPVHEFMAGPATAIGAVPHTTLRVDVALVQPLIPVRVRVATNEPELNVGVNIANAGLEFCVNVPGPAPLHIGLPE